MQTFQLSEAGFSKYSFYISCILVLDSVGLFLNSSLCQVLVYFLGADNETIQVCFFPRLSEVSVEWFRALPTRKAANMITCHLSYYWKLWLPQVGIVSHVQQTAVFKVTNTSLCPLACTKGQKWLHHYHDGTKFLLSVFQQISLLFKKCLSCGQVFSWQQHFQGKRAPVFIVYMIFYVCLTLYML